MNGRANIERMLEGLSNLQDELVARQLQIQELKESVIPQEVKIALAEIDAEAETVLGPLREAIAKQEAAVKEAVLNHGGSVKAGGYNAVYAKPRESWDTKRLDGYAAANPEILSFKKVGQPSVSLRKVER